MALPDPPDFAEVEPGKWRIEFDDPVSGLNYVYAATATWEDRTTSPFAWIKAGQVSINSRHIAVTVEITETEV
jgi:hypothetical protein